jgi:hypothetical protein
MDAATARIEYSTSIIMRDIATMVMDIDYATVKFGSAEMDEDLALALSVEVEVLESEHEKWTQTVKDAWATATSNRSRMRPTFVRLAENYEFLVWQMENFLRVSKNPRAGYSAAIVRKTAYGIVALSEGVECMTTRLHQDFFTLAPKTDLDQRRRTVFDSQECALVALSSHMRARAKSRYRTPI